MAVGTVASELVVPFFWSKRFDHWPVIARIIGIAAAISVPVTAVLIYLNNRPFSFQDLVIQYGYVLVISLLISTGVYILESYRSAQTGDSAAPDQTQVFLRRLPVKFRTANLYAITSEDHYLRVHTSMGSDLILMRLADAVKELGGADGLQVHRSWWVAKAFVKDEKKENGRSILVLADETQVPVSRSYRAAAKEAGLIS